MSNNIGKNEISNFFIQKYHTNKISIQDAKDLGIDVEKFKDVDVNDDDFYDIDEIADNKDFYAAVTSIIEEEKDNLKVKDAEKEKEEQKKVQQKDGASNK